MVGPGGNAPEQGGVQELLGMLAPPTGIFGGQGEQVSYGTGGGPAGQGGVPGGGISVPPALAQYFDSFGNPRIDDPRKVAAESGVTLGGLAGGLFPGGAPFSIEYKLPSDQGGFFTVEDLFGLTGQMGPAPGALGPGGRQPMARQGGIGVPQIGTFRADAPSTNNWRLLGMGPGWGMRNGQLVNFTNPSVKHGFPAGLPPNYGNSGEQFIPSGVPSAVGTGAPEGVPNLVRSGLGQTGFAGWPGGLMEQWLRFPPNL